MTRFLKYVVLCVIVIVSSHPTEAATVISESVIFLQEDGQHYLAYDTRRTSYSNYYLIFTKKKGLKPDDHLKDCLYVYPNEYRWDTTSDRQHDLLRFSQGSYAMLNRGVLEERRTVGEDGIYTFKSWDGAKRSDGHYGIYNTPDDFFQYVYAWVFPQRFEIVGYQCNRKGEWVQRYNTIAYYGKNVNDLVFTIKYRPKAQATYEALSKTLKGQEQVQLEQQDEGVKITVGATVLFPSGSSELTEKGKSVLRKVIETLKKRGGVNIVVEGHTDNIPIKGDLAKVYPTNWELSAARSLSVLHYLVDKGIPESRLESRAYGSQRPIASNETDQGRTKNRRIELMIMESAGP